MTFRSAIPDFQLGNPLYTAARVTFFTVDQDGASTGLLATLYSDPVSAVTTANPQSLDSDGKFVAPVYIDAPVIAEVVGPNIASHRTGPIAPRGRWKGAWVTAIWYYVDDVFYDPSDPTKIYIVAQDHLADVLADDITAGKDQLLLSGPGDTLYIVLDDAGLPASGERWRMIISEAALLLAGAPHSYANAVVAATGSVAYSIRKKASAVETEVGTITFAASGTDGVFAAASDVNFAGGDELILQAPSPRDATLSDVAITLKLFRVSS